MGFCEHDDETTDSAVFINTVLYGDTNIHFNRSFST